MAKKKILITGATGFIGERLTQRLLQEGNEVRALCRSPKKARALLPQETCIIEGDLDKVEALEKAMDGCEEVYHLAAYAKVWDKDPQAFYRVNVEGAERVAKAALTCGVRRLVFTSTAGVLGPSPDGKAVDESQTPVVLSTEYERTKAEAERVMQRYVEQGLDVVIVNPTRVFGPGQLNESNAVTKLIALYRKGKFRFYPGSGHQFGNYVYVEDVVRGHLLAMEKGRKGERYILGGHNVSYRELFDKVAEVLGKRYVMIPLPLPLMMTVARFEQWKADTWGRPPLITPPFVRKYHYDWRVSIEKAQKELGYEITPLETAIAETLRWLEAAV
jgi:nucleoside-diphosphate-sugar epimerase